MGNLVKGHTAIYIYIYTYISAYVRVGGRGTADSGQAMTQNENQIAPAAFIVGGAVFSSLITAACDHMDG